MVVNHKYNFIYRALTQTNLRDFPPAPKPFISTAQNNNYVYATIFKENPNFVALRIEPQVNSGFLISDGKPVNIYNNERVIVELDTQKHYGDVIFYLVFTTNHYKGWIRKEYLQKSTIHQPTTSRGPIRTSHTPRNTPRNTPYSRPAQSTVASITSKKSQIVYKVMSFNVHVGGSNKSSHNHKQIYFQNVVNIVTSHDPDLLFLQETNATLNSILTQQNYVSFNYHGVAIFMKRHSQVGTNAKGFRFLDANPRNQRPYIVINDDNQQASIVGLHSQHGKYSDDDLKKEILPKLKYPDRVIIGGDFNRNPNGLLQSHGYTSGPFPMTLKAYPEPSKEQYTGKANMFADGILYKGLQQSSVHVDTTPYASDHFPVILTF